MPLGHERLGEYEGQLFDEILYQEPEILAKIDDLAAHFIEKYKDTEEKPLFICLLRGGALFSVLLMLSIAKQDPNFHPELDYMIISKYQDGRTGERKPIIVTDVAPSTKVADRHIEILDEVLDTGDSLDFTKSELLSREPAHRPKSVSTAVLVQKDMNREYPEADIYGFLVPEDWQTGFGMDDSEVAVEGNRWMMAIAIARGALAKRSKS